MTLTQKRHFSTFLYSLVDKRDDDLFVKFIVFASRGFDMLSTITTKTMWSKIDSRMMNRTNMSSHLGTPDVWMWTSVPTTTKWSVEEYVRGLSEADAETANSKIEALLGKAVNTALHRIFWRMSWKNSSESPR